MEVSNPRRILAVSLDNQADHLSRVIKDLTGSSPTSSSASLAGTSHDLPLKTQYYTATVPIWLDLITSPSEWSASFLSDEAGEVLSVLGGLVLVFALPSSSSAPAPASASETSSKNVDQVRDLIHHVGQVVSKGLGGWEWDGVRLAIGVGESEADEWDELCADAGLEFVQIRGKQLGLNEFGEKTGISRVREALESNDWAHDAPSDFGDFESTSDKDENLDPESLDFGFDRADFEGLRKSIWEARPGGEPLPLTNVESGDTAQTTTSHEGGDGQLEDDEVVKVEKMMRKLQAVREAGEGLPEAQRKRMAARAVEEVMKEL